MLFSISNRTNVVSSSEAVYQINRRWEHFVCVPRRSMRSICLLSGPTSACASTVASILRAAVKPRRQLKTRHLLPGRNVKQSICRRKTYHI